jgi:hypothetical protein
MDRVYWNKYSNLANSREGWRFLESETSEPSNLVVGYESFVNIPPPPIDHDGE